MCFRDNLLLGLFPLQQLCLIIYLYNFIDVLFIAQQALYIISTSCCNLARALMEECSGDNEASSENGVVDPTYSKVKHINVLVTSGSLIPSLVKCMLFRLDDLIAYKNVYSSWEVSKLKCFEWIKERWGNPNVRFCVIGDGWEECEAAQRMRWPFIQIDTRPDGVHRFPGLTLTTVGHYLSVIYGSSPAENDKD